MVRNAREFFNGLKEPGTLLAVFLAIFAGIAWIVNLYTGNFKWIMKVDNRSHENAREIGKISGEVESLENQMDEIKMLREELARLEGKVQGIESASLERHQHQEADLNELEERVYDLQQLRFPD